MDAITNWETDEHPHRPRKNEYWGEPEDITTESGSPPLPVSVQECKDYMRLEGFVDTDESTTESLSNFLFDDALITRMIWAAVKKAEKWCGISIVFHTWKDIIQNGAGDIELRMGPIRTFLYMRDIDEVLIPATNYTLTGYNFKTLDTVSSVKQIARYDAGYIDIPDEILLGLMQMVFYWYVNRKGKIGDIPMTAMETLRPFRRGWTYVS